MVGIAETLEVKDIEGSAESDSRRNLIKMELGNLRKELHDLKTCQIQFVTFAFTASGIILSIKGSISPLIPLVIILPTWCIFFDKAKSVSRIIGYYRILENEYLGGANTNFRFVGWENAQSIYREREKDMKKILMVDESWNKTAKTSIFNRTIDLLFLRASSYWTLVYFTFFGLAIVCFAIYFMLMGQNPLKIQISSLSMRVLFSAAAVLISAGYNIYLLNQLVWGKHSYRANEVFWKGILSNEELK